MKFIHIIGMFLCSLLFLVLSNVGEYVVFTDVQTYTLLLFSKGVLLVHSWFNGRTMMPVHVMICIQCASSPCYVCLAVEAYVSSTALCGSKAVSRP